MPSRRIVRRLATLGIALSLAIWPSLQRIDAGAVTSYQFVRGTYTYFETRDQALAAVARSRAVNAGYLSALRHLGTSASIAEADAFEGRMTAIERKAAAIPLAPTAVHIPVIYVLKTRATASGVASLVRDAEAVNIGTMAFSQYSYDSPSVAGNALLPITNFVSSNQNADWGNPYWTNWYLVNSPQQPWNQTSVGENDFALLCRDGTCQWFSTAYQVSIGPDYGGTRKHARLWGTYVPTSDNHNFTISDAHQDSSTSCCHCLSDLSAPRDTYQYSILWQQVGAYRQDFGNAGNYAACPWLGAVYYDGSSWVQWV